MTGNVAQHLDNPMWAAIADHVRPSDYPWERGRQVGGFGDYEPLIQRTELTSRYAWTITAPETVAFVVTHAGPKVVDPLAGSGYWAYLLGQAGVDVIVSDLNPPDVAANHWHQAGVAHVHVAGMDAVDAVTAYGSGRTLLLAWPPYDAPIGADVLNAFPGDRVIYIGEGEGGCCGDDDLFELLGCGWVEVANHRPVQWLGIHDYVTVYDRENAR
jgi:hypothetical protein